jgi:hypothetical protein
MTEEQRARHNAHCRAYYASNAEYRKAQIERALKRCTVKKAASKLTKEQLERRRASDAARQARRRAAKKASAA